MSQPIQLSFTLRTSASVRTVHLLGSWDNYTSQLPLSSLSLKDAAAKPGSWRGTFRFQASHALKPGSRYWYYYIIDGYHVSHDPAKESVVEKTTGRKLNILDVPKKTTAAAATTTTKVAAPVAAKPTISIKTSNLPTSGSGKRQSRDIPVGRPLTPTKIMHPKPQKPHASRAIREADYEVSPVDDLEARFAATELSSRASRYSPASASTISAGSEASGTMFSSASETSSCTSDESESDEDEGCRCGRYGVTRSGQRIKLDCGGAKCGYTSSSDEDDDDESDAEHEREAELKRRALERLAAERIRSGVKATSRDATRRYGMVVDDRRRR